VLFERKEAHLFHPVIHGCISKAQFAYAICTKSQSTFVDKKEWHQPVCNPYVLKLRGASKQVPVASLDKSLVSR